jgi:hypothetical protein
MATAWCIAVVLLSVIVVADSGRFLSSSKEESYQAVPNRAMSNEQ